MADEDIRRKVRQFVSHLMRESSISLSSKNTLIYLSSRCHSPQLPCDESICSHQSSNLIRQEFLSRHFTRRPFLLKLFSFVNVSATSKVERQWRKILLDIFSSQSQDAPVPVCMELLFTLRQILDLDSTTDDDKQLTMDAIQIIILRQRFLLRLMTESCLVDEDICDISNLLINLPSVISNKTKGTPPAAFELKAYTQCIASQICAVLGQSKRLNFAFIGHLVGRFCHSGNAVILWSYVLSSFSKSDDSESLSSFNKVLQKVNSSHLSSTVFPLFLLSSNWRLMASLLVDDERSRRHDLEAIVRRALIGHFHVPGLGGPTDDGQNGNRVIRTVVRFAAFWSTDIITDLFQTLLYSWSAPHAVDGVHVSYTDHYYRSRALLAASLHVNVDELNEDVRNIVLSAITRHLSSTVHEIRLLGMVVGEVLVDRLKLGASSEDAIRLKFEYEETADSRALKSMLRTEDDEDVVVEAPVTPAFEENSHSNDDEKEAPKTPLDSDDDEDDEFPAMNLSEDLPISCARSPKYIRDCIEGLRSSKPEEMDYLTASVEAAERMIRAHPSHANEVAEEFAQAVIHLAPDCPIPSLQQKRIGMLVALSEVAPMKMGNFLSHSFYLPNLSIAHRLDILAAIADSAQRLSDQPSIHGDDSEKGYWKNIEVQVTNKSRQKLAHFGGKPNKFGSVAGHFFFPLLAGFDRPTGVLDLQRDHIVLSRLLLTLACVISCAHNSPALPNMAAAMFDFVFAIRGHSDISVRRGLLFACASVAGVSPSHLLLPRLSSEMADIREWLKHNAVTDPDQDCRQLATWASTIVGARFRDFIQIT